MSSKKMKGMVCGTMCILQPPTLQYYRHPLDTLSPILMHMHIGVKEVSGLQKNKIKEEKGDHICILQPWTLPNKRDTMEPSTAKVRTNERKGMIPAFCSHQPWNKTDPLHSHRLLLTTLQWWSRQLARQ
jgi:hypothetical protein